MDSMKRFNEGIQRGSMKGFSKGFNEGIQRDSTKEFNEDSTHQPAEGLKSRICVDR